MNTPLYKIFETAQDIVYDAGQVIIRPEDEPQYMYLVTSGFIKIYSITKYGEENIHVFKKKGDLFPLLYDSSLDRRELYFKAMENVSVKRAKLDEFNEQMYNSQDSIKSFIKLIVLTLREQSALITTLENRTTREKLLSYLLDLANKFGQKHPRGTIIPIPLKQHDIANSISMTRETVNKELKKLKNEQIIKMDNNLILILDKNKLINLVENF